MTEFKTFMTEEGFPPTNPEVESLSLTEILFVVILPSVMTVVILVIMR